MIKSILYNYHLGLLLLHFEEQKCNFSIKFINALHCTAQTENFYALNCHRTHTEHAMRTSFFCSFCGQDKTDTASKPIWCCRHIFSCFFYYYYSSICRGKTKKQALIKNKNALHNKSKYINNFYFDRKKCENGTKWNGKERGFGTEANKHEVP